jgi:hypothetical protein
LDDALFFAGFDYDTSAIRLPRPAQADHFTE